MVLDWFKGLDGLGAQTHSSMHRLALLSRQIKEAFFFHDVNGESSSLLRGGTRVCIMSPGSKE